LTCKVVEQNVSLPIIAIEPDTSRNGWKGPKGLHIKIIIDPPSLSQPGFADQKDNIDLPPCGLEVHLVTERYKSGVFGDRVGVVEE